MEEIITVREAKRKLRHEIATWQVAALGMFMLSMFANLGLSVFHGIERQHWEAESAQLRSELRQAEAIRDHAVRELGALAGTIAQERLDRQEQAAAYEALGDWKYLGEFTVTAYCPCEECCGRWADGVTASGIHAGPGIVAVDPDVIQLGSTVIIDGQKYLAADTGSGVKGLHIDICVADHNIAISSGVTTENVWIENK